MIDLVPQHVHGFVPNTLVLPFHRFCCRIDESVEVLSRKRGAFVATFAAAPMLASFAVGVGYVKAGFAGGVSGSSAPQPFPWTMYGTTSLSLSEASRVQCCPKINCYCEHMQDRLSRLALFHGVSLQLECMVVGPLRPPYLVPSVRREH